ncbi:HTH-type transcriptional activator IlvY [Alteromonas sp. ASW11-130]|uniref:HTH-type transcriptional activator IlvY n=1 Tax=Alteromonas sp. ASW11-130 TaxID=3015775 RepID=UPI0022429E47|nr:HTH-type transcriptional activator IlvY [Alteromonas sp. ASW11-130]MCW8093352.1 HTH-type transcriptional activator IlvY [Alteromonas sp. ASW11-130]
MDFRSLTLFTHLAKSLHFGQTALAMHVTASTLSRVIQRLEDECQCTLFVRNNRSVKLTHEGKKLLSFSEQTLQQWQQLQAELNSEKAVLRGEVKMYCSVTASQSHLPKLLSKYRQQHPHVDIRLTTGDPASSIERVLSQQCDIAIAIHTEDFPNELIFTPIDYVPLVLITPREFNLSQLKDIDWQTHQVILPEQGPSRNIVRHWFQTHCIAPHIYASVGGNEAIVSMVALGCGIGFVPQVVLDHSRLANKVNQIQVSDISGYQLGLTCLKTKRSHPLVKAMLQLALN